MKTTYTISVKTGGGRVTRWTQADLKKLYRYEDGDLADRVTGDSVGTITKSDGRKRFHGHLISRWVYLYHHGVLPDGKEFVIDHVNDDPTDDRIENLQILPNSVNLRKGLTEESFRKAAATRKANGTGFHDPEVQRRAYETQKRLGVAFFNPAVQKEKVEACKRKGAGFYNPETRRLGLQARMDRKISMFGETYKHETAEVKRSKRIKQFVSDFVDAAFDMDFKAIEELVKLDEKRNYDRVYKNNLRDAKRSQETLERNALLREAAIAKVLA